MKRKQLHSLTTGRISGVLMVGIVLGACSDTASVLDVQPELDLTTSQTVTGAQEPVQADVLTSDLPTGPRDTGTYPDLRTDPESRITEVSPAEVAALEAQMAALANDHQAGRVSTAAYQQRLAYLRRLAQRHSSDMLEQIGEPAAAN